MGKAEQPMSILDHFAELRRRLLVAFAFVLVVSSLCFLLSGRMLGFVTKGMSLIYTRPSEGMMAHFRVALTTGIVTVRFLRSSRKYAVILIFIVAAIATPPDVISQVLMAVPLLGLYELGILLVAGTERRRHKQAKAAEAEEAL